MDLHLDGPEANLGTRHCEKEKAYSSHWLCRIYTIPEITPEKERASTRAGFCELLSLTPIY